MIRKAAPDDANAVLTLTKAFATSFEVNEAAFHATFATLTVDEKGHLIVAEQDGVLIGYALAFCHGALYANGFRCMDGRIDGGRRASSKGYWWRTHAGSGAVGIGAGMPLDCAGDSACGRFLCRIGL